MGDIYVVWAGKVVVAGRPKKPETVLQYFEHSLRKNETAFLGLGLQNGENQLLLPQAAVALDAEALG